jgi:hypothetical protein
MGILDVSTNGFDGEGFVGNGQWECRNYKDYGC